MTALAFQRLTTTCIACAIALAFYLPACAQDYFHTVEKRASPLALPVAKYEAIKTVGTSLSAFGVPFKVNADNASFIEVQLYLSKDMGETWSFHSRQSTDQTDFAFQSEGDGEYWFCLKTLDRDRRLLPEGDPQPELKIIVDTKKPTLDFRIQADAAGRVVCRWSAEDKNLLPNTLRILYQPVDSFGNAKEWQPVPVHLNGTARVGVYADQLAWWPETSERQLNVVVEIKDIAGNTTQVNRQVLVQQTGWRHRAQSTAQITDPVRRNSNWRTTQPLNPMGDEQNPSKSDQKSRFEETAKKSGSHKTASSNIKTDVDSNTNSKVVCKDGVCQLVPDSTPKSAKQAPPNRTAQAPKLFPNQSELIADALDESGFDYAAPPIPTEHSTEQTSQRVAQGGSIPWPSDLEQRRLQNRASVGTTIGKTNKTTNGRGRPNPSLAPLVNPNQQLAQPATNVPSNPGTMKRLRDQVIGESSTMGRTNQYRGLKSRTSDALPRPDLLPGSSNSRPRNLAVAPVKRTPNTNPVSPWTNPQAAKQLGPNQKSFSKTGFRNQASQGTSVVESQPRPRNTGRVPMQIIGSQRFRLAYGIDAIDPSGVAKVDLWMTRDGRNWSAWGSDPDNQSPFPVAVEQDGKYGFRIVVRSKDGLTGQGPSTGDEADMWVQVDTQSPLAHITSVPYGRGDEAGRLVVNYSAADDLLTLRPITLSYGDNPNGPWIPIGEGLRNEGRFVWKPQSNVPDQIYLRIDALDKAGNVGVHVLSQVIDVSGLVPRGTIRGVVPVRTK